MPPKAVLAEWLPAEAAEVQDPAAVDMLGRLRRVDVTVNGAVVPTSYFGPSEAPGADDEIVLMLHGFDSSALEFRRLAPLLEAQSKVSVYAVDIMGWGFTDPNGSPSTADGKRAHLQAFWEQVIGRPVTVLGASLGGAVALDFAVSCPEAVSRVVFLDATCFLDGAGPAASLPKFMARWGVRVLASVPLRTFAQDLSYFDKDTFATEDALRIGRLGVFMPRWEDASLDWIGSGGFISTKQIPLVDKPTLVIWGRQDQILEPGVYAGRFVEEMKDARLEWVEDCGHVPHLEKPEVTSGLIAEFLEASDS